MTMWSVPPAPVNVMMTPLPAAGKVPEQLLPAKITALHKLSGCHAACCAQSELSERVKPSGDPPWDRPPHVEALMQ